MPRYGVALTQWAPTLSPLCPVFDQHHLLPWPGVITASGQGVEWGEGRGGEMDWMRRGEFRIIEGRKNPIQMKHPFHNLKTASLADAYTHD